VTVALDDVLELHPSVSLRPERFGALAYSFDTRKLSFLKHPDLVAVVESLDGARTVGDALDVAGIDPARRPSFLRALDALVTSQMVRPAEAPDAA
jgi:putative mycofactocin binding protein MftB